MDLNNWVYKIKKFFPVPIKTTTRTQDAIAKSIVSQYAQGNVSLYLGRYTTSKEIEKRKAALANYRFAVD